MSDATIQWNTAQLKVFAASLRHDPQGRNLKKQMEQQFDSITESLRDKFRQNLSEISGVGPKYPQELEDSVQFTTKLIGGKNARVSIVGKGKTRQGKWRETGKLLEQGILFHPAWGHWRGNPPPWYLEELVPSAPKVIDDALDDSIPGIQDDIRSVLNDYLDKLATIRKGA